MPVAVGALALTALVALIGILRPWPIAVSEAEAQAPPPAPAVTPAAGGELLARQRAALAADRERLHRMTAQAVDTAVTVEFGAMRLRAPAYAAWSYGWVQSYVTSYHIVGRGLAGAIDHLMAGREGSLWSAVTAEAASVVREQFRDMVVQPETTQRALDDEWSRIAAMVDHEFAGIERRQESALAALGIRLEGVADRRPRPAHSTDGLSTETPDIDTALLRSARPMAARAGILVLRLTEIGSVAAIVGSLGISLGPFSGVVVGLVGGIGVVWGLDYVINAIDAALHRDELEAHAIAVVDSLESEARQGLLAGFREEIDARISALDAALTLALP